MDHSSDEFKLNILNLLDEFFVDLDLLRNEPKDNHRQLVHSLFRRAHTIKGSATTAGLEHVAAIAHQMETVLAAMRDGQIFADEMTLSALEDAANLISSSIVANAPNESVVRAVQKQLDDLARTTPGPGLFDDQIFSHLPSDIWQSLTDSQKVQIARQSNTGAKLFIVTASFDSTDFDEQFFRLRERLEEIGDVVSTYPSVADDASTQIEFRILFASRCESDEIAQAGQSFPIQVASVNGRSEREQTRTETPPPVRLAAHELDRLIPPLQELSRLTQMVLNAAIVNAPENARESLERHNEEVRTSLKALEAQLNELRLVPVEQILKRAERVGRAAAQAENKTIGFEISGADIRIDKSVAAQIADALIHLVRNAVSHGIESAYKRVNAGKPASGHIQLEAKSFNETIVIRVADDGRGIDPASVAHAATTMGLISANTELTLDDCVRFIFEPGLTTAPSVSTTSGRGIGLDVVQTSVKAVGGEVVVTSEANKGAVFELHVPIEAAREIQIVN